MSPRRCARVLPLLVLVLGTLSACGDIGQPVGWICDRDEECSSGQCELSASPSFCTDACADASDCPAELRCGVHPPSGERHCARPCEVSYDLGFVCKDEVLVACEDAGPAWNCWDCGCADDEYCDDDSAACVPDLAVGQPCSGHDECASENCTVTGSDTAGFCQVAEGAPCTPDNCESCDRTATGTSCAQSCGGGGNCDSDQECIGDREADRYYCRAECDPGDPDTCAYGWRCQNVELFTTSRWLCSPSPTCDPATSGCGDETCESLAGTSYAICVPTCSPVNTTCPLHWSCAQTADWYACRPPPP